MADVITFSGYFNPRPREGSDSQLSGRLSIAIRISIHAPERGATFHCCPPCTNPAFQSTPPRGERRPEPISVFRIRYFNPRPREGSDRRHFSLEIVPLLFQSTPPRGERPSASRDAVKGFPFQSTPPRGERPRSRSSSIRTAAFQSTPPRGERLSGCRTLRAPGHFNPRPREGSDHLIDHRRGHRAGFQSTPPERGATSCVRLILPRRLISIHAPREGSDGFISGNGVPVWISIHAPREGSDQSPPPR